MIIRIELLKIKVLIENNQFKARKNLILII